MSKNFESENFGFDPANEDVTAKSNAAKDDTYNDNELSFDNIYKPDGEKLRVPLTTDYLPRINAAALDGRDELYEELEQILAESISDYKKAVELQTILGYKMREAARQKDLERAAFYLVYSVEVFGVMNDVFDEEGRAYFEQVYGRKLSDFQ